MGSQVAFKDQKAGAIKYALAVTVIPSKSVR